MRVDVVAVFPQLIAALGAGGVVEADMAMRVGVVTVFPHGRRVGATLARECDAH